MGAKGAKGAKGVKGEKGAKGAKGGEGGCRGGSWQTCIACHDIGKTRSVEQIKFQCQGAVPGAVPGPAHAWFMEVCVCVRVFACKQFLICLFKWHSLS